MTPAEHGQERHTKCSRCGIDVTVIADRERDAYARGVSDGVANAEGKAYAENRALVEALREIRALDVNDGLTDAEAFDCVQTIATAALDRIGEGR